MAAKRKADPFVRCFEVSEPRLHEKGHTIYKVTLKTIKVDAPDEDVLETVLWKRFNDFKKLYKAMFTLHKALHRQEEFPPFARSKVFGRFDEQVITERQQSAQDLLNFAGQRHYLVNSPAFKLFLEGGQLVTVNPHSDPVLEPLRLGHEDSVSLGSDSDLSSVTSSTEHVGHDALHMHEPMEPTKDEAAVQDLGGVWQYRQATDNISLDDEDLPDDLPEEPSSLGGVPLPDADLALFDPMRISGVGEEPDPAGAAYSNLWLLSALSELNADTASTATPSATDSQGDPLDPSDRDTMGKGASKGSDSGTGPMLETVSQTVSSLHPGLLSLSDLPEPPGSDIPDSSSSLGIGEFDPYKSFNSLKVSCGHGDTHFSLTSDVKADSSTTPDSPPPTPIDAGDLSKPMAPTVGPATSTGAPPHKRLGSKPVSATSSPAQSPRKQLMTVELGEKGKYIVDAARQISLAQQCEANGNHHMAFTYYKNCVGVLLTGVQGDDNSGRREVVRRKTARYLMKAEEIYNKYLVIKGTPDDNRWDTGQSPTQELTQELDPRVAYLQGPVSEVANFRVLGIIDCVLLVLDQTTNATYVMKILHKNLPKHPMPNLVPCMCPYIVRLHRFYETETAVYLLLQHATGGKLWTYVSGFLNQHQEQLTDEVFPVADIYNQPTLPGNIYTGQYLHKSPTVKELVSSPATTTLYGANDDLMEALGDEVCGDRGITMGLTDNGEGSERGEGEGSSLGDLDLAAPVETAQSYTELLMGDAGHQDNLDTGEGTVVSPGHDEIISPDWRKAGDGESRKDGNLLNLDCSQDVFGFHKAVAGEKSKPCSALSEDASSEGFFSVAKEYRTENIDKFEELLKEAHRPSLENFSINSFDSDSAPGSRFDSTASDYNIESIPEVSETSPAHSDKLVVGPSPTSEEVFLVAVDRGPELITVSERAMRHNSGKSHSGQSKMKPLLISPDSNVADLDEKDDSLRDKFITSTPMKINVMDSPPEATVQTRRDPILGLEVAPKGPDSASFAGSFEEPSIYDKSAETDTDSGSVTLSMENEAEQEKTKRRLNLPDPRSPTEERAAFLLPQGENAAPTRSQSNAKSTQPIPSNKSDNISDLNSQKLSPLKSPLFSGPDNGIHALSPVTSPSKITNVEQRPPLLRRISGERSLDTVRRLRKRTLSGVFGELDLAEEGEKEKVHLPEGCVRQWAAEMITAIASLHRLGIICKDLRPDNILLGDRGHILLTYFSQWNCIQGNVDPTAIAGLYSAPEVSSVFDVTTACDWWSVGVLLFELLTGKSLVSCYPGGITSHTTLVVPEHVSAEAQSLLYELLHFHPSERLGSGINGADDIRHHPFFASITWADLRSEG